MEVNIGDFITSVQQVQETIWRCKYNDEIIGIVKAVNKVTSSSWPENYEAFVGNRPQELKEATVANIYPSLRAAIRAVVVSYVTGKTYTYVNSNVTIKEGKAVLINGYTKKEESDEKDERIPESKESRSREASKGKGRQQDKERSVARKRLGHVSRNKKGSGTSKEGVRRVSRKRKRSSN